jgi:hypothetical protein
MPKLSIASSLRLVEQGFQPVTSAARSRNKQKHRQSLRLAWEL